MANEMEVKVPNIGDLESVPVIEVLVADGDTVEKDQPLLVLESDKATMEVPSPAAGIVKGLKVKVGDKVGEGTLVCMLSVQKDSSSSPPSESEEAAPPAQEKKPSPSAPPPPQASPASDREGSPSPKGKVSGGSQTVTVPNIGDFESVPVIEVLVADGDTVEKDQPLIVLESDKATMEVPSPAAGIVKQLKVKVGDKVGEGAEVCVLSVEQDAAPSSASERDEAAPSEQQEEPSPAAPPSPASGRGRTGETAPVPAAQPDGQPFYAGPATRKVARQFGVDLSKVKGSGARGRIVIEDVQAHVKSRLAEPTAAATRSGGSGIPPIPGQDFSQFGPVETKALARIRKLSAAHLTRSWLNVPHVTQHDDADITELEAFRKSAAGLTEAKLTLLPFLIKAVGLVMKRYPEFNSSLSADGESIVLKGYCNIGFAADTPNGLVVPVVKDVWNKSVGVLAADCARLATAARDGKLKPDDMKGGCFSISSLGGIGGKYFTPIVNAPEVAILGVSRSSQQPVWDGQAFAPRLMLPLSLSYDHRVIDGAAAARFIVLLGELLADVRRWIL